MYCRILTIFKFISNMVNNSTKKDNSNRVLEGVTACYLCRIQSRHYGEIPVLKAKNV